MNNSSIVYYIALLFS